jgi:two-component system CheB/CheR fusion protein
VLVSFVNVTGILQAEAHQKLLIAELNHRVKNMLAVISSTASLSLARATSLEEFGTAFLGRVDALGQAYMLLSRDNWTRSSLRELVSSEIGPLGADGQSRIKGPELQVPPKTALTLAMAIHELATNAVKYGALSHPEGRLDVTWRIDEMAGDGKLVLDWIERGGPVVRPPATRGFGSTLIERSVAYELRGEARLSFPPEGATCRIIVPLENPPAPPKQPKSPR